ncbi:MAG: PepSY domain-containing protein [Alphaproteobacteria bacterium]|nr:PepSY domain-containing protein [Alphaproteobacteria bacterium]MBU0797197.1 PepSY domain-containing protein [Alphaproteobacteria bacterium]MBU0887132.1 PepSY domain-containing protein [Alphaproteobacteria bacterium]MBU1814382.1 PepSY domain-containing protein [Alphaproteobacteria bacterium]
MGSGFRASMNWLHTWAGVVIGALLFAIFWMGTLSVFDREIDRWMMPASRLAAPDTAPSLEQLRSVIEPMSDGGGQWWVMMPTDREPAVRASYSKDGVNNRIQLDPSSGAVLPKNESLGGTRFIYPFHYSLHIQLANIGRWLVGLAAMGMLALIVTGVIIHVKIFKDFFTLRTDKKAPRIALDLHNVTGVLGLPFHFLITLSGLIIFMTVYFPNAWEVTFPDRKAYFNEAFGQYSRPKADQPGKVGSLDSMAAQARQIWEGGEPYFIRIWHPNDANAYVEMRRGFQDAVTMNLATVYFDGSTGAILARSTAKPVLSVQRFISGMHYIQFRHWTLRWVYFALGLSGCVMIGTGFLFWLESRRKRHTQQKLAGVRVVEGLAIGSTTGIILATLAFFVANRLLPAGIEDRASLEVWAFCVVWVAGFLHAWLRRGKAWADQAWAIAGAGLLAVVLNALTTGDHLVRTVSSGLWSVAGMDMVLLAGAVIAGLSAWRLSRKAALAKHLSGSAQHA